MLEPKKAHVVLGDVHNRHRCSCSSRPFYPMDEQELSGNSSPARSRCGLWHRVRDHQTDREGDEGFAAAVIGVLIAQPAGRPFGDGLTASGAFIRELCRPA